MDVSLVQLDRHLNNLTTNYESFESVHRDNRRELDIKLEKHQVSEGEALPWNTIEYLLAIISIDQRFRS